MNIIDCPQRSDEWYNIRLGRVTASHFADVLNKKSGRNTYMMRLLAERVTGLRCESYSNKNMETGTEREPEAREYYEWVTDHTIQQVGFVELTEDVGCSPDGLIDEKGLVEIKCPLVTTHLTYILKNTLPANYKAQVQGQMWVCGRDWCDFVSYNPEYLKQPLWTIRVKRDNTYITQLSAEMSVFVAELKQLEEKLL